MLTIIGGLDSGILLFHYPIPFLCQNNAHILFVYRRRWCLWSLYYPPCLPTPCQWPTPNMTISYCMDSVNIHPCWFIFIYPYRILVSIFNFIFCILYIPLDTPPHLPLISHSSLISHLPLISHSSLISCYYWCGLGGEFAQGGRLRGVNWDLWCGGWKSVCWRTGIVSTPKRGYRVVANDQERVSSKKIESIVFGCNLNANHGNQLPISRCTLLTNATNWHGAFK